MGQLGQLAKLGQLGEPLGQLLISRSDGADPATLAGRTKLLVLQPTSFCNLDCSYCYLPNRTDRRRMSVETVSAAVNFVVRNGLAGERLTLVWHSGEPMVVPPAWYREAHAAAVDASGGNCRIDQSIQTNGVLLTQGWLSYLRESKMRIGISLDGPADVHNLNRRDRRGQGTHRSVMRGVETLRMNHIPFHVIAVVTRKTLENPQAFCSFFEQVGMTSLGLNFEEIEGINKSSDVLEPENATLLRQFLEYLVQRAVDNPHLRIREVRRTEAMLRDPLFDSRDDNDENKPFAIISVDTQGNLSTFSPEMLGQKDAISNGYVYGNVHRNTLSDVLNNADFLRVSREIAIGVSACQKACAYFRLCRGGAPANKAAEWGDLTATETRHCQTSVKTFVELILSSMERRMAARGS